MTPKTGLATALVAAVVAALVTATTLLVVWRAAPGVVDAESTSAHTLPPSAIDPTVCASTRPANVASVNASAATKNAFMHLPA